MTIQSLAENADKPFIVKESDLDIFGCEDYFDFFQSPTAVNQIASHGDAWTLPECHLTAPPLATRRSRRSSISSVSSSCSSSMCSKSLNYEDESFVSYGDQSETLTRTSESRKYRRSSSRRKGKKQVSFHSRIKIRSIPLLHNLSEEELTNRWYRGYELAQIKHETAEIVCMAKNNELLPNDDSLRGLRMSKKQQRRSNWIMAMTCVLDEQKRQAREKVNYPEQLAKLYGSFAFTAQKTAEKSGRQDAEAIREEPEM
jgi:hypothetical protein